MSVPGIICICLILLAGACKKEEDPSGYRTGGTYVMYRIKMKESTTGPLDRDTTVIPCLTSQILRMEHDGTWKSSYIGRDPCYSFITTSSAWVWQDYGGIPNGQWTRVGNTLQLTYAGQPAKKFDCKFSISNSKRIISFPDTGNNYLAETWYIEQ